MYIHLPYIVYHMYEVSEMGLHSICSHIRPCESLFAFPPRSFGRFPKEFVRSGTSLCDTLLSKQRERLSKISHLSRPAIFSICINPQFHFSCISNSVSFFSFRTHPLRGPYGSLFSMYSS